VAVEPLVIEEKVVPTVGFEREVGRVGEVVAREAEVGGELGRRVC
jgi:hypothetical protein